MIVNLNYQKKKYLTESEDINSNGNVYYEQNINLELIIHSDIKKKSKKDINFFYGLIYGIQHGKWLKKLYDKKTNNDVACKSVKDLIYNNISGKNDNNNLSGEENNYNKIEVNKIQNGNNNDDEDAFEKLGRYSSSDLSDIIYKLKHITDLNELINKINSSKNLRIDRENMKIKLNSFEFVKFYEIKDYSNLELAIYYSLSEKWLYIL